MLIYPFLTAAAVQLVYWSVVLHAAYHGRPLVDLADDQLAARPVSIVVCFRNEEKTLGRLIELILGQTYTGGFELILVDDNSTDNSASVVHPFAIRDARVRLLEPGPTRPGKKDALTFGIEAASHELLLLTDADCLPASNYWLRLMAGPLHYGAELVLGASPYLAGRGASLLARWQRFESVYVSLKYLGFARRGHPYMGVGRNLAYAKSFFRRAGGFVAHADLASGDDDLLVSAAANPKRTFVTAHPGAWSYSYPKMTWSAYFRQRARHQSTGSRYPKFTAFNLTLLAASHGFFYLLAIAAALQGWAIVVASLFAVRLAVQFSAYYRPYILTDPATFSGADAGWPPASPAFNRDAKVGWGKRIGLLANIVFFDIWIGVMYLYLAVAGVVGKKTW